MSKGEAMAIKSRVVKRGSNLTTKIEKLIITIKALTATTVEREIRTFNLSQGHVKNN